MSNELINIDPLKQKNINIAQQIVSEDDAESVKKLVTLFNANQQKKSVLRVLKLEELIDTITDKVKERVDKRADELTSQELLQCLQVITNSIEKANKDLSGIQDVPIISYSQNNQINVNITDGLSRESREKITDVVRSILNKADELQYPILEEIEISEVKDAENE